MQSVPRPAIGSEDGQRGKHDQSIGVFAIISTLNLCTGKAVLTIDGVSGHINAKAVSNNTYRFTLPIPPYPRSIQEPIRC